ncbi:MAG: PDZ domain-containing protein [Planctomycetia bacterium]
MPATEQTWRNLKTLHVVFAVAALVLLVATVLLLAVDHNRPWKKYQREFRALETWSAAARIDEQESRAYEETARQLDAALADARRSDLDSAIAESFTKQMRSVSADAQAADLVQLDIDRLRSQSDPDERLALRGDLLQRCRDTVARAKFREDNLAGALKLRKAELDKNRADYELAIADGLPEQKQASLLALADAKRAEVEAATLEFQSANTHRKSLESLVRQLSAAEDTAAKAVSDHRQKITLLKKTLADKAPNVGKSVLELPVLDAFNGPLRVDQIWLPQLTLNNNFRDVARFDRCVTCHRGMDKSMPGAPSEGAYPQMDLLTLSLSTPADPAVSAVVEGDANVQLESLYGFQLAPRGLFEFDDPTVSVVLPESVAAKAGLRPGDVIEQIAGGRVAARSIAATALVEMPSWGRPLSLVVRRGVPQPYSSHPRLDLFVSDSSPHPMKTFGCTICHQGQGSSTSFKWSSHTPNSPKQAHQWHDEHGWFNNHHWILPMLPQRFEQSSCLKCHHQVVDLEPSPRFPEPPADKLVAGYHLIRQYGCYGCHEINGWAGPDKRIGPDMRVEPSYHEVAEALLTDPGLAAMGDTVVRWARDVKSSPDGNDARARLRAAIERDAAAGAEASLSPRSHALAAVLRDPETPGTLPKVGPSLRHAASKLNFDWTFAWLRNPQEFRPSTKMPRFFGLWEHLEGKGLAESRKYEPVEIRSMIHYLSASSAPFEYVPLHAGITAKPDAARGKKVFQLRGCLACHKHDEFPEAASTHGPDLSRMGGKLAGNPNGRAWLYSWLREPARYHPKTIMPNVLLEPVPLADGTVSDPAADAVEYLMASGADWKPAAEWGVETLSGEASFAMASAGSLSADERAALDELAMMYLKERFTASRAQQVLASGLAADQAGIQGDEQLLVGLDGPRRDAVLLGYVGKKTIAKLACYSCHDIPGFEDGKPAGAALADWGRKDPSRIAFEQASHFVTHQLAGHGHGGHAGHAGHGEHGEENTPEIGSGDLAYAAPGHDAHHIDPESVDPDTGYFLQKLLGHEREGFLWQKLRQPRSYDYKKVENKTYNERYRMPQFPFDDGQREAVMTFVLGLVAEPPAPQFVHRPSPREQARLDGLVVAEQYNCGGCHALEMDRWDVRYAPGSMGESAEVRDYPFLASHFTPHDVQKSLATDSRGLRQASIIGMPVLDPETGKPQFVDEDGVPVEEGDPEAVLHRPVMLWRDLLVDGEPRLVGSQNIIVPEAAIQAGRHYPARGGDLATLLFPVVIADEKQVNPNVKPDDAWGWLPPPLVGEGKKVQSNWLHRFLLNPQTIRPSAVLRMPKFNFQSQEAAALVEYFAAVDGVDSAYVYDSRLDESSLVTKERSYPGHLDGAMKIVTNNNYCVKCHLVGSYAPPGNPKALAPQLERVHERLRPGYVHDWIANPKRFLPYTGMPVNIPFDAPVSQDLYKGTSEQQVDALTDLLMHFDAFAKRSLSLERYLGPLAAPRSRPGEPAAVAPQPQAESVPARASVPSANPPSVSAQPPKNSRDPGVALN